MQKRVSVNAIKNGTVIDRIPPEVLFKVIYILNLENCMEMVTFGNNLESTVIGQKGIIKISNRYFNGKDIDKISLFAPDAVLNTIKEYQVVEKRVVKIPTEVKLIVKCFNPRCITNHEEVPTQFSVIEKSPITLKCHYCEKITHEENIQINNTH